MAEGYNEEELNKQNKEFLAGYDWAVAEIKNMFDNLNVYPEVEDLLTDNRAVITSGKVEMVTDAIDDWAEMQRKELIISMIDGQYEE